MLKTMTFGLLLFCVINCSSKKNISQSESFAYQNGNEKIVFEILNGNNFLEVNVPTRTKFIFDNIDPETVSLSGKTIRFLRENDTKKNELLIEMSPKKSDLEDGKLKIFLSYKSNGEFKMFKLNIQVKTK